MPERSAFGMPAEENGSKREAALPAGDTAGGIVRSSFPADARMNTNVFPFAFTLDQSTGSSRRDKQPTFVLLDEWLPPSPPRRESTRVDAPMRGVLARARSRHD